MRRVFGVALVILALILTAGLPVIAAESNASVAVAAIVDPTIGVSVNTSSVDFGNVNPATGAYEKSDAVTVTVRSNAVWNLAVAAAGDFSGGVGKTIPISKLSYSKADLNSFTGFSTTAQTLTSAESATAGKSFTYDYKLSLNYDDAPGAYNTSIRYIASN